jgi:hypothetical protein
VGIYRILCFHVKQFIVETADRERIVAVTDVSVERLRSLLDYDSETGVFTWRTGRGGTVSGAIAGSFDKDGYRIICVDYRRYPAHRLAWLWAHGVLPQNMIDHANRDPSDNRLVNLRPANKSENARNSRARANSTSGVIGVSWSKQAKKWWAYVSFNRKQHHLGLFNRFDDAVAARKAAEVEHFGEFAPSYSTTVAPPW